jgi:hypothetical protein
MPGVPEVFISYAWGTTLEDIVKRLCAQLGPKGYHLIIDKIALGYKGKIREFMNRIGKGKAVVVVLSKKYLESENCMYEALQIAGNGALEERILPIVLPDADIYDPLVRLSYLRYWDEKIAELNEAIRGLSDLSYINTLTANLNLFKDIRRFIDGFMGVVANMNVLTPEKLAANGFQMIAVELDALFARDKEP